SVMASGGDFQMGAKLSVKGYGAAKTVDLVLKKEGEAINYIPVELKEENLRIILKQVDPMSKKADIIISKLSGSMADVHEHKEVLSISASVKPFVSLVWIGTAVLVIGFFVSMFRRLEDAG
ncbi:MAG: cytochrome C biogenesis protein, partial [Chitinophagaceae bacterium]|nr:cytochrome C biogenesis protein [Chitinophagaceae bacterium]